MAKVATGRKQRLLHAARVAGLATFWIAVGLRLWPTLKLPWDFATYYYAALALRHGLDPYRLADLARLSHSPIELPFIYPAPTLLLFLPFTLAPFAAASMVWLAIELGVLLTLLSLWRRCFLERLDPLLLLVAAVLGFNGALVWDLRSGNVALIEALLLWKAFACYVAGRRHAFTALVVLASMWKLTPAFYLGLLLVPSRVDRPRPTLVAAGLLALTAWTVLPMTLGPHWARSLASAFSGERPWGFFTPCALGVIDSLLETHSAPLWKPPHFPGLWWLGLDALLLVVGWPALRRTASARDPRQAVIVAVLLYGLLAPRMVIYTYVMMLVPALVLGGHLLRRAGGAITVTALISLQALGRLAGFKRDSLILDNGPFLLLLALWLSWSMLNPPALPDSDRPASPQP